MSTITREQLTRIIDSAGFIITALSGDDEVINAEYENNHSAAWDKLITEASPEVVRELARIALASQGAKKIILYRERNPYNGLTTGWEELTEQEYEIVKDNASKYAEFRTVYTAPPAPVVPNESAVELLASDLMKRIDKITGERHSEATLSSLRVSIVEACRAAMLQGAEPVTTANKLGSSPEIPDGYVLVPKEPTEEMLRASYHEASVYSAKAYRAMLAASPQQEV